MKNHPLILWAITAAMSVQTLWSEPMLVTSDIVKANNAFALDLYKNLAKEPENLVVSPFSIDTALAISYAVRGEKPPARWPESFICQTGTQTSMLALRLCSKN